MLASVGDRKVDINHFELNDITQRADGRTDTTSDIQNYFVFVSEKEAEVLDPVRRANYSTAEGQPNYAPINTLPATKMRFC